MSKPRRDTPRVVVVGSVHMDLIANAPLLPSPGESVLGTGFAMYPGGKGGNQAVASAQQGVSTTMVARVGDDAFGAGLRQALAAKGVDVSLLLTDPTDATGVSPVLMAADGEYASIVVPGASLALQPSDVERASEILGSCDVLMLQLEIGLATSAAAARMAASSGALVVMNVAPAPAVREIETAHIWRDVDLVLANRAEAQALTGILVDNPDAGMLAASVLRRTLGVAAVVVTLGSAGAALADGSEERHVPGYAVDVVDTIGAGDAFAGAVGATLSQDANLAEAVRLGNAAGALAVGRKGAYDAPPTREETESFLSCARPGLD